MVRLVCANGDSDLTFCMQDPTSPSYCFILFAQNLLSPLLNGHHSADAVSEKQDKKKRDYTFWDQLSEKPSITSGC